VTPELIQYDPRAGLQAIADSYGTYKKLINPNSAVGMSALSSIASKESDAQQKYANDIEQQNMQLKNQHQTMVANLFDNVNRTREQSRAEYHDIWQRALATRDANIDRVQGGLEQKFANNRYQNALIDKSIMNNEGVVEVTKPLDSLLGRRILDVDREGLNKKYLKVEEDEKTQEELLANVKMLLQQQKDQKATKLT
jgi:hypothetical protein